MPDGLSSNTKAHTDTVLSFPHTRAQWFPNSAKQCLPLVNLCSFRDNTCVQRAMWDLWYGARGDSFSPCESFKAAAQPFHSSLGPGQRTRESWGYKMETPANKTPFYWQSITPSTLSESDSLTGEPCWNEQSGTQRPKMQLKNPAPLLFFFC